MHSGVEKSGLWEGNYGRGGYKNTMYDRDGSKERRPMPMMHHDMKETSPMNMSMADMSQMLAGKTGDALDRAFLEGMIPHHQGAVDMAKYLSGAKHPELRKMGEDIIKAQTAEIEQMKKWMTEWGYTSTGTTTQTGTMMHMMPDGTMMRGGM